MARKSYIIIDNDTVLDYLTSVGHQHRRDLNEEPLPGCNSMNIVINKHCLRGIEVDISRLVHLDTNNSPTVYLYSREIIPDKFFEAEQYKEVKTVKLFENCSNFYGSEFYSAVIVPNGYVIVQIISRILIAIPIEVLSANISDGLYANEQKFLSTIFMNLKQRIPLQSFNNYISLDSTKDICYQILKDKYNGEVCEDIPNTDIIF